VTPRRIRFQSPGRPDELGVFQRFLGGWQRCLRARTGARSAPGALETSPAKRGAVERASSIESVRLGDPEDRRHCAERGAP
jgi:hypothetical protein